jgi:L-asparagine transporter-like permease
MVIVLFQLRRREPNAPFRVPLYPWLPWLFLMIYLFLLIAGVVDQPVLACVAAAALAAAYGIARSTVIRGRSERKE